MRARWRWLKQTMIFLSRRGNRKMCLWYTKFPVNCYSLLTYPVSGRNHRRPPYLYQKLKPAQADGPDCYLSKPVVSTFYASARETKSEDRRNVTSASRRDTSATPSGSDHRNNIVKANECTHIEVIEGAELCPHSIGDYQFHR